jgi:hypothetical protein
LENLLRLCRERDIYPKVLYCMISNFQSEEQFSLLHDREHFDLFEVSQNNANNGQRMLTSWLVPRLRNWGEQLNQPDS